MKNSKKKVLVIALIMTFTTYAQISFNTISKIDKSEIKSDMSNIKAEITITDSKTIDGFKNLKLELSNGLSFTYEDGNCKAGYKTKSLDVRGKYSITCEAGTLSLAFNADDGSIWWVFRPKN